MSNTSSPPDVRPILNVEELKTYFYLVGNRVVRAVDGVNLSVYARRNLGILGESGCGKSVTALSILRVLSADARIVAGKIELYRPNDNSVIDIASTKDKRLLRSIRGCDIAMIFQEPMSALSPVHTIGNQIIEAILLHQKINKKEARQKAIDMLERVGIPSASRRYDQYTFELSGGMRQRAMIAMALCCQPRILLADEPTTAVDVTIQAQIIDLLHRLQEELQMSIVLITHDLPVIAEVADDLAVMYLGQMVEYGLVADVLFKPLHPYTEGLLNSVPKIGAERNRRLWTITGNVPDAYSTPQGCRFHPRCARFMPGKCDVVEPLVYEVEAGRKVKCLLYEQRPGSP